MTITQCPTCGRRVRGLTKFKCGACGTRVEYGVKVRHGASMRTSQPALGDAIARLIKKNTGIKPCGGCNKRKTRLNQFWYWLGKKRAEVKAVWKALVTLASLGDCRSRRR